MNLDQFIKERNEALVSLDETKIRAYAKKYGAEVPEDPEIFWGGVHKAITALPNIPENIRERSEIWLKEHNSKSFGDMIK